MMYLQQACSEPRQERLRTPVIFSGMTQDPTVFSVKTAAENQEIQETMTGIRVPTSQELKGTANGIPARNLSTMRAA